MNSSKKPKKNFLNVPTYPGGKKAFDAFIRKNLVYPAEALQHRIEGDVMVTYEVDDNGVIHNPVLKHGIGYGCDQEALRLVKMLLFPRTTNRGVRVKSKFTTRIPFRLAATARTVNASFNYQITPKAPAPNPEEPRKTSYSWQININTSGS